MSIMITVIYYLGESVFVLAFCTLNQTSLMPDSAKLSPAPETFLAVTIDEPTAGKTNVEVQKISCKTGSAKVAATVPKSRILSLLCRNLSSK